MCYLHRGFIREIPSPTGSFFREITNLRQICGEFQCATSTGSSPSRDISHGHDVSYEGWGETTPAVRRQTRDLPPPLMLNDVTTTYNDNDGDNDEKGGVDNQSE